MVRGLLQDKKVPGTSVGTRATAAPDLCLSDLPQDSWERAGLTAPSEMRCAQSPDRWWGGEETGAVAAGEFPKVPQRVFFFLGKILLLTPVTGYLGQGRTQPNFQLSLASARGLPGFTTSSLFSSLQLQATRSLTEFLGALSEEVAVNLALSQES